MDALEKLAEKNRIHSNHVTKDKRSNVLTAIYFVPVVITYLYSIYSLGEGFFANPLNVLAPTGGAFFLSLLLYLFVNLLIFSHKEKAIGFFVCQCWFTYFWNSSEGVALSFMPLIIAFIIFAFQFSKIKVKLLDDKNGI